jgi:hypothetical protein
VVRDVAKHDEMQQEAQVLFGEAKVPGQRR